MGSEDGGKSSTCPRDAKHVMERHLIRGNGPRFRGTPVQAYSICRGRQPLGAERAFNGNILTTCERRGSAGARREGSRRLGIKPALRAVSNFAGRAGNNGRRAVKLLYLKDMKVMVLPVGLRPPGRGFGGLRTKGALPSTRSGVLVTPFAIRGENEFRICRRGLTA